VPNLAQKKIKRFLSNLIPKPCDVRAMESLSTFSCVKPCITGGATQSRTGLNEFTKAVPTQIGSVFEKPLELALGLTHHIHPFRQWHGSWWSNLDQKGHRLL
jgi:hypothetical protein